MAKAYISEIFDSIQGEGIFAGARQIFIRFSGCNLKCSYCDTKKIRQKMCRVQRTGCREKIKNPLNATEVIRIMKKYDKAKLYHSVSLTGGEPLLQADFLKEFMPILKKMGLKIYLETNGTLPQSLKKVISFIDFIAMDIKLPSAISRSFWSEHKKFFEAGKKKKFVKVVIDPKTKLHEVMKAAKLVASVNNKTPFVLQPATLKNKKIFNIEKLLFFQKEVLSILEDVRIIPQMHVMLGIK